jgi:hypothetical protein
MTETAAKHDMQNLLASGTPAPPAPKEQNVGFERVPNGTRRVIDGKPCVFYDGYWIRYYSPPRNTWAAKKYLIDNLTKRLFHHTEGGINTPGDRLEEARRAYEKETNPRRKRVNGAMLAGALFNRATDIFTSVVELAEKGVRIRPDNELIRQCGRYFQEALALGKTVKHYSGEEGIDELWGEPFKAFVMPIKNFYESRYIKVALTMRDIDRIGAVIQGTYRGDSAFEGIEPLVREMCEAAKLEAETLRTDPAIFQVWPRFVAACEAVMVFKPRLSDDDSEETRRRAELGCRSLRDGKDLITWIASARVPMPKSTREYLDKCRAYARLRGIELPEADLLAPSRNGAG